MNKAERLKELLGSKKILCLTGCYDVLSAKIIEKVGFQSVFVSGYGVSASMYGMPDIGLITLTEMSEAAKRIANAVSVPVVVDIDTGYGGESNVERAIAEHEHNGVAGVMLEDQVISKRCGHLGSKEVEPVETYVRKLETALKTRKNMRIIGRTDATELGEAIRRGQVYRKTGADIILVEAPRSKDDLMKIRDSIDGEIVVNLIYGGKTPLLTTHELERIGYNAVIYSTPALFLATKALFTNMQVLREVGALGQLSDLSVDLTTFNQEIWS